MVKIQKCKRRKKISFRELQALFGKSSKEAAELLGISITQLKRVCRENDIPRWPGRRIKSLENKILKFNKKRERAKDEEKRKFDICIESLRNRIREFTANPKLIQTSDAYLDGQEFLLIQNRCSQFGVTPSNRRHSMTIQGIEGKGEMNIPMNGNGNSYPIIKARKFIICNNQSSSQNPNINGNNSSKQNIEKGNSNLSFGEYSMPQSHSTTMERNTKKTRDNEFVHVFPFNFQNSRSKRRVKKRPATPTPHHFFKIQFSEANVGNSTTGNPNTQFMNANNNQFTSGSFSFLPKKQRNSGNNNLNGKKSKRVPNKSNVRQIKRKLPFKDPMIDEDKELDEKDLEIIIAEEKIQEFKKSKEKVVQKGRNKFKIKKTVCEPNVRVQFNLSNEFDQVKKRRGTDMIDINEIVYRTPDNSRENSPRRGIKSPCWSKIDNIPPLKFITPQQAQVMDQEENSQTQQFMNNPYHQHVYMSDYPPSPSFSSFSSTPVSGKSYKSMGSSRESTPMSTPKITHPNKTFDDSNDEIDLFKTPKMKKKKILRRQSSMPLFQPLGAHLGNDVPFPSQFDGCQDFGISDLARSPRMNFLSPKIQKAFPSRNSSDSLFFSPRPTAKKKNDYWGLDKM